VDIDNIEEHKSFDFSAAKAGSLRSPKCLQKIQNILSRDAARVALSSETAEGTDPTYKEVAIHVE